MSVSAYRATVVGSTVAWFLLGLHLPGLHHVQQEHNGVSAGLVIAMSILVVAAIGGLTLLLRSPRRA